MGTIRKRHSAAFKAKVALDAAKEAKTISELASEYGVHPNQIRQWKKRLLDQASDLFSSRREKEARRQEEREAELYRQIGQLKVERDWLKKKSDHVR
jgi:putative transposase